MEFHAAIVAVFIAYFLALIAIAVFRANQMRDMTDYVLAGRRMSSFTSALSAGSSATSGWTMLVFPALAFSEGAVHLWTIVSLVLGAWFTWTVLAARLRRYTIATESLTLPDFLEKRFGDRTGVLRALTAVLTIFFIMLYINSGLIAGAKLMETVFGATHNQGVLITLLAVASYTFIGGFMAVSRTDVFQALVMLVSLIILPLILITNTAEPFLGLGNGGFLNPLTDADGDGIGVAFLLSTAGWGLGSFGSQRIPSGLWPLKVKTRSIGAAISARFGLCSSSRLASCSDSLRGRRTRRWASSPPWWVMRGSLIRSVCTSWPRKHSSSPCSQAFC